MGAMEQKLKLLHLANILETETDDEHGLTGPQIIEMLAERGVEVERKTLYRDLQCLREFGYNIQKYQRSPIEYGLATHKFQDPELMLLADAVQSSKFLTTRKAASLVRSISQLGSRHQKEKLRHRIHVEGRIKSQNESVFYNVDAIQRAMAAKKKVRFRYFKLNEQKERVLQRNGSYYCETPVQLLYTGDFYYLIIWSDKYQNFTNYRVDRMQDIRVSEEPATRNRQIAEFDVAKYQERSFGMFNGESVAVSLLVKSSVVSSVIDRFGKDVDLTPAGEGLARAHVTIMATPTFYGWLAQFGDQIMVEHPASVKAKYTDFLRSIVAAYEK